MANKSVSAQLKEAAVIAAANASLDVAQAAYACAFRFAAECVDDEEVRQKLFTIERLLREVSVHVRNKVQS